MTKPEYLVSFLPYSHTEVHLICRVTGDTEKYWKCLYNSAGDIILVRKSNLKERGSDTQYYPWTKEEVISYRHRRKVLNEVKSINFNLLSTEQLEDILKTSEGGKQNG